MWKAASEREMAIWSRVVARLEENLRHIRWRIIVRKMNHFAKACWRYADRLVVDKRIDGGPRLVPPKDWCLPKIGASAVVQDCCIPSPWDDDNWDDVWGPNLTGMHCIGNGASSSTHVASPVPPPTPVVRRCIVGWETF